MADPIRINLALQGGGAHGAYVWGVLDRMLEEPDLEIAAISGTSAGALNGAALKAGLMTDGRTGARAQLDWLRGRIGALDDLMLPDWMQAWLSHPGFVSRAVEYSPGYTLGDTVSRMLSPYGWGRLYRNPLERIVEEFDFGRVCATGGPEFCVGATCVRDGKIRVFEGGAISTRAILASACRPRSSRRWSWRTA